MPLSNRRVAVHTPCRVVHFTLSVSQITTVFSFHLQIIVLVKFQKFYGLLTSVLVILTKTRFSAMETAPLAALSPVKNSDVYEIFLEKSRLLILWW